ncbi:hypothetical protein [Streptomyces sp. rh34]|uniref:hypothetical protein n=1 Tax=Streptomyces sp. rh34 TaxID=2034272 RepID=UPI0015CF2122|nr:hypothetical protein [Streptomyces sp. rh34]
MNRDHSRLEIDRPGRWQEGRSRRRCGADRLLPHLDTEGEAALERDAETKT